MCPAFVPYKSRETIPVHPDEWFIFQKFSPETSVGFFRKLYLAKKTREKLAAKGKTSGKAWENAVYSQKFYRYALHPAYARELSTLNLKDESKNVFSEKKLDDIVDIIAAFLYEPYDLHFLSAVRDMIEVFLQVENLAYLP